jgi:hypothetical protein
MRHRVSIRSAAQEIHDTMRADHSRSVLYSSRQEDIITKASALEPAY